MARLKKKDYEKLLAPIQIELNNLAHWLQHTRKRMVVLFEGRDAAGKGGVIHAIAETLNPRQVHIVFHVLRARQFGHSQRRSAWKIC